MKYRTWYIKDTTTGRYYSGYLDKATRKPLADEERQNAMSMDEDEIKEDFPDGLPEGWVREDIY